MILASFSQSFYAPQNHFQVVHCQRVNLTGQAGLYQFRVPENITRTKLSQATVALEPPFRKIDASFYLQGGWIAFRLRFKIAFRF